MLTLPIKVNRASVCAGDDCDSHEAEFFVSGSLNVIEMLSAAMTACPLASIAGEQATWLIDIDGQDGACIGVMAQQWPTPRLTVPSSTTVADLFSDRKPALYFRYWCQANPDAVFEAVRIGAPLPKRYS